MTLIAVGFNALLVTICWFLLPDKIVNWLFTLHGPLAFPYFLEMWMLGDTPATNVAGRDAVRAAQQLHDPAAIAPVAAGETHRVVVLCRADRRDRGDRDRTGAAPLRRCCSRRHCPAVLAARRAECRRMGRHLDALSPAEVAVALAASFRLAGGVGSVARPGLVPFLIVPAIAVVLLIPSLIIWIIAHQGYPPQQMDTAGLWIGTAVSVAVSLTTFAWAPGWPRQ